MRVFLFILIVTSGFQLFGYALVDVLLLTGFILLLAIQNKSLKIKINWVLIFCIFMMLQSIRGMYVLGDIRMLYWLIFFVTLYFSHQYFMALYMKSKIDLDFAKRVFNFSMLYFIILTAFFQYLLKTLMIFKVYIGLVLLQPLLY